MTIANNLFQAILAMDAYNRGYDQGLKLSSNSIGTVTLDQQSDTTAGSVGVNASFFAQSYVVNQTGITDLNVGQKIISYRGTDDFVRDPEYYYGDSALNLYYGDSALNLVLHFSLGRCHRQYHGPSRSRRRSGLTAPHHLARERPRADLLLRD